MSDDYAIKLEGISKHYKLYPSHGAMARDWSGVDKLKFWKKAPSYPIKKALDNISLTIPKGERIGIIGRNGAGKTTLLKVIADLIEQSSGKVSVNGKVQALMRLSGGFHPDISGAENVKNSLLYNGLRGNELEKAYLDVLDFAELGDYINQPVQNYSLGMAARLNFAAATAIEPDILIIDEVLGAGDSYFAEKSVERMKALTSSGCTLLLVSHSRGQILEFCNKALWLDDGAIRDYGDIHTITAAYDKELTSQEDKLSASSSDNAANNSEYLLPPGHMSTEHFKKQVQAHLEYIYGDNFFDVVNESKEKFVIQCVDCHGDSGQSNQFSTGDNVELQFSIKQQLSQRDRLNTLFMDVILYDEGGNPVACVKDIKYLGKDREFAVSVDISPCPLGHRTYMLCAVLRLGKEPVAFLTDFVIKIIDTNDSDPPLLHCPSLWYIDSAKKPSRGRVSGIQ